MSITNGEKYVTAKERAEACKEFMKDHKEYDEMPYIDAAFHWLDIEAEEEKPLPCPFCGHPEVRVYADERNKRVYCPECGFAMPWRRLDEDIYEEYNRVAKAVGESEAR